MSELDLDAIEANARHWDHLVRDDPETTLALVAEVRRLRGLVPQPPPPGVVIVSWSGRRHIALPGSKVQRDGSKRALCSDYTWGVEPDADGDATYGTKQGKRADLLPMCKSCTRSASSDG